MMTVKILDGKGEIDSTEWRFLLAGSGVDCEIPPNPTNWIDEIKWPKIYRDFMVIFGNF